MSNITIDVINTYQPIGNFFIAKINAKALYEMSSVNRLMLEMQDEKNEANYIGLQREINENKIQSLQDYIESPDSTFPNSIILNVEEKYVVSRNLNKLVLEQTKETFSVIDGQHRLESFRDYQGEDFELVVSIFIGLSLEEQARIFITINSEQTKVNPSIQTAHELKDKVYTPRKMVATISMMFAKDIESPWVNKIKILGYKDELSTEGIISLSAFSKPIIGYIYDDRRFHLLRAKILKEGFESLHELDISRRAIPILWKLYITKNESVMYKILFNYFSAISEILKKEWKSKDSLLTKTTGYNAMMLLFNDVILEADKNRNFSLNFFKEYLYRLEKLDGTINSKNYGASGEKAARELYQEFKKYI